MQLFLLDEFYSLTRYVLIRVSGRMLNDISCSGCLSSKQMEQTIGVRGMRKKWRCSWWLRHSVAKTTSEKKGHFVVVWEKARRKMTMNSNFLQFTLLFQYVLAVFCCGVYLLFSALCTSRSALYHVRMPCLFCFIVCFVCLHGWSIDRTVYR